jgi:Sec-independent protein secretion pathway component TatC
LLVLYEVSILISKRITRQRKRKEAEESVSW